MTKNTMTAVNRVPFQELIRKKLGKSERYVFPKQGNEQRDLITNVNLDEQSFEQVDFFSLYLDLCSFDEAIFTKSNVDDVYFFGCIFMDANFPNSTFSSVVFYDLSGFRANFANCTFEDVIFLGCNLECTNFCGSSFSNVEFVPDNIGHRTNLIGADFQKCDFRNVTLKDVEIDSTSTLDRRKISIK